MILKTVVHCSFDLSCCCLISFMYMSTGDLTDAKDVYKLGSKQYKEEWEAYYNVLKETKVEDKTKWLDLRGNHGKKIQLKMELIKCYLFSTQLELDM